MDVTFFEQPPYYPKSNIQGENFTQEYQLWDIESEILNSSFDLPSSQTKLPNISIPPNIEPEAISICHNEPQNTQKTMAEPNTMNTKKTVDEPNIVAEPSSSSPQPNSSQPAINSGFRVYSRREKAQEEIEHQTLLEQIQKSNSSPRSLGISQGNTQSDSELSNNDLDCPITLRKGVRSCTNHSIYNFVSYEGLSPSFRVFVTNLNKI